jgi:hypothetical protein
MLETFVSMLESILPDTRMTKEEVMQIVRKAPRPKEGKGLILTPIATSKKTLAQLAKGTPDSNRDYEEQLSLVGKGADWHWDDSCPADSRGKKRTPAKVNDLFGFYFHKKRVVIHKVTAIHDASKRMPSWGKNIGQGNRKVLALSAIYITIPWKEWIELAGAKKCQGTYNVDFKKGKNNKMYNAVQNNFI